MEEKYGESLDLQAAWRNIIILTKREKDVDIRNEGGDSKEKSEDRNIIISELLTVIKELVVLIEFELPWTITFQVMSGDGGNVPVGAGEVLLLRYSATHLEYSHELEDENLKFNMAVNIIYCKEQKGLFGKVKYKTIKHRKEIITEADWKNGKKVSLYVD